MVPYLGQPLPGSEIMYLPPPLRLPSLLLPILAFEPLEQLHPPEPSFGTHQRSLDI